MRSERILHEKIRKWQPADVQAVLKAIFMREDASTLVNDAWGIVHEAQGDQERWEQIQEARRFQEMDAARRKFVRDNFTNQIEKNEPGWSKKIERHPEMERIIDELAYSRKWNAALYKKVMSDPEAQMELFRTYNSAPAETVMAEMEGVLDQFSAQLQTPPSKPIPGMDQMQQQQPGQQPQPAYGQGQGPQQPGNAVAAQSSGDGNAIDGGLLYVPK